MAGEDTFEGLSNVVNGGDEYCDDGDQEGDNDGHGVDNDLDDNGDHDKDCKSDCVRTFKGQTFIGNSH